MKEPKGAANRFYVREGTRGDRFFCMRFSGVRFVVAIVSLSSWTCVQGCAEGENLATAQSGKKKKDAGHNGGDAKASVEGDVRMPHATLAAGTNHVCAILAEGQLKCWGSGYRGGIGAGDERNRGERPSDMGASLVAVALDGKAISVVAGGDLTCAILEDERLKCWGANTGGMLGLGDTMDRGGALNQMGSALPAVDLGAQSRVRGVSVSETHACALLEQGRIKCWGSNSYGELGVGDKVPRGAQLGQMGDALPYVDLGKAHAAKAVSVGNGVTCAILDDDRIKCWGSGLLTGLSDPLNRGDVQASMGDDLPYVDLGTGRTALSIVHARAVSCALLDDGSVKCWGGGGFGLLGSGSSTSIGGAPGEMGDALRAVDVGTNRKVVRLYANAVAGNVCVLLDDTTSKCWGKSATIGLDINRSTGDEPGEMGDRLPMLVLGTARTASEIGVGWLFICARLDNDAIKCWGNGSAGKLGQGDLKNRFSTSEMGDALPPISL